VCVIGLREERRLRVFENRVLRRVNPDTMLIPYEQLFIQANHKTGNLVPEQNSNETNPLFQLIIDRMPPPP
jgi:hypothetical protein